MAAQLRLSSPVPRSSAAHLDGSLRRIAGNLPLSSSSSSSSSSYRPSATLSLLRSRSSNPTLSHPLPSSDLPCLDQSGGDKPPGGRGGSGGGGHRWGPGDHNPPDDPSGGSGPLDLFFSGWRSRVAADPQFPFKVLMEELVGVTANVLGDMASRPNFGLNELDFVFCTLVVGSIVNFVIMYLLAPTAATASASSALPGLFASCPASHMFQPGPFSPLDRFGTFVYKGVTFAAVGFAAGLAGTAISNGLIRMRKLMDPEFETPNKPPPTVLNALTWALHMGVSANFRYQTLNGVEFVMAKAMPPAGFKASVVVLRCLNNVLGGMTFVMLARATGSQKSGEVSAALKEGLIGDGAMVAVDCGDQHLQESESQGK